LKKYRVTIIKGRSVLLALLTIAACALFIAALSTYLSRTGKMKKSSAAAGDYLILAASEQGMYFYQRDFDAFLLLPPGNTLRAQVFRLTGEQVELVNSGIDVFYSIVDNTTSADKINFWNFAAYYGYDVEPNVGITGNGLSGRMQLSQDGNYYVATAIPLTPYNDGSRVPNPYQLAVITVTDSESGEVLAQISDVVMPVADEMGCLNCHGIVDTNLNILSAHDRISNTNLLEQLSQGTRHRCADCHRDNALGASGVPGVPPLSQAIHRFHADRMLPRSGITPDCYRCHPGPVAQFYRGAMYMAGISCTNANCHGDMLNVALTQAVGRQAWLNQPDCSNCHREVYGTNMGKLYHESYLLNSPDEEMNNIILCISCHNSAHAEWVSTNSLDNLLPIRIMGYPDFIRRCTVCHRAGVLGRAHAYYIEETR
jgi:hypothetical protein